MVASLAGQPPRVVRLPSERVTSVRGETRTVLTCTAEEFLVNAQLDAYELDAQQGDPRVYSQNWERRIPRDLV